MKVAILAGGAGSRLAEETKVKPKPIVEIGGLPILWHIMKIFDHYDFKEFVIALGYKGEMIREFFENFAYNNCNVKIDLSTRNVEYDDFSQVDWKVELISTGLPTLTGGRIKRLKPFVGKGTFMCTYGDGVSDLNLRDLVAFHRSHGKLATLTAVRPPARYGHLKFEGDRIVEFVEKPQTAEGWINGGFFVLEPEVFDYIEGDQTEWSREPLEQLAREGQLMAYRHDSYWQCMDTLREKQILENLWHSGSAPWKVWD
jgi:glucose-1-phosphate cytidylyltransferase